MIKLLYADTNRTLFEPAMFYVELNGEKFVAWVHWLPYPEAKHDSKVGNTFSILPSYALQQHLECGDTIAITECSDAEDAVKKFVEGINKK